MAEYSVPGVRGEMEAAGSYSIKYPATVHPAVPHLSYSSLILAIRRIPGFIFLLCCVLEERNLSLTSGTTKLLPLLKNA